MCDDLSTHVIVERSTRGPRVELQIDQTPGNLDHIAKVFVDNRLYQHNGGVTFLQSMAYAMQIAVKDIVENMYPPPDTLDRGHSELETVLDAAIAYRESQRAYNEGTLKERVPNGTRINECQAALDTAITAVKENLGVDVL